AIVPFQPPLADLYDASRLAAAGLLSTTSQVVGLIVGVRVLVGLLAASAATGRLLAIVLAAASMFVGSALAFKETRLKRMLAYLVVSNAGFGLIGLAVGFADVASPEQSLVVSQSLPGGVSSVLFHAVTFIVSAGGLTAVIVYLSRAGEEIEHIEDLAGIGSREPPAAICAGICLLSLAGIPPFPGFWGRLFLIASSLSVHLESQRGFLPHPNPAFLLLGLVAAGSMVMASAAWLRILATIFFNGQVARPQPAGGQPALAAAILATTLLVGAGLLPGPLVGYIDGIVTAPAAVMTGAKNVGRSNRSTAPESGKARDVENGTGTPAPSAPAADRQP
ncbi:MAG: proton-conducting transporter membrane subunit, partial [Planctomycetaceae bacterium]